jgi:lipopolysaccharide export system permease protein
MIRILDRYVTREFLRLFVLFALAAPLLFVLGDWTDNIDTFTERQLPLSDVALGYLFKLPQFILFSLPIAGLIATVFTVSTMTRHSEMAAAKAGGISFHRATIMLPVLGVMLTGFGLFLSELVPITLRRSAELHGNRNEYRGSRNDFVYRAEDGTVYGIRRLDLNANRVYGMTVQNEGDGFEVPTTTTFAREAVWDSTAGWTLNDGVTRVVWNDTTDGGSVQTFEFGRMALPALWEQPEELLAEPREPDEMRYAEMGRFINALRRSGGKPFKLMFSQAEKIAIPVATLIIILFGAPLANTTARGGPAYGIGISLGVTIVYLVLFRVAEAVGNAGIIDPVLSAWAPNALFFAASLLLIARVRT